MGFARLTKHYTQRKAMLEVIKKENQKAVY
jgi:hypothetical protein